LVDAPLTHLLPFLPGDADFGLRDAHAFFGLPFLNVQRLWHEEQLKSNQRETASAWSHTDGRV
jgi:hypothetical protein